MVQARGRRGGRMMGLEDFGIRLNDVIAGFSGGLVNAFVFRRADPASVIGSMIVGALSANYLTEWAARQFATGPGATGFIIGLSGMAICQGIVNAVRQWKPSFAKKE